MERARPIRFMESSRVPMTTASGLGLFSLGHFFYV
jgi:hypothetical protein